MKWTPLNLTFGSGELKSRSQQWQGSGLTNMYLEQSDKARSASAVMPWPGENRFSGGFEGFNRGSVMMDGVLYILIDQELWRIGEDQSRRMVVKVPGYGPVSFVTDDEEVLLIRVQGTGVFINRTMVLQGEGLTFHVKNSTLSVVDLPNIPKGGFACSSTNNFTRYTPENTGTAESNGDDILQSKLFSQKIYFGGIRSFEVFEFTGIGSPPVQRVEQGITTSVGVASKSSMECTNNYLYFLGSDNVIYQVANFRPQPISPPAIVREMRTRDTSDAIGSAINLDGMHFYILQLPNSNYTIAYNEQVGHWMRLSSGVNEGRHILDRYFYCYGRHLITDYRSGTIWEWDFDSNDHYGEPMIRSIRSLPITSSVLGIDGQQIVINGLTLVMETGTESVDVPDPFVKFSMSIDGGRSDGHQDWVRYGRSYDGVVQVYWDITVVCRSAVIEISVSDAAFASFHSANIAIRLAGR